ncbi:hypothetical protein J6590_085859 [Homalodisca vitripennis]|nr:hypothetical protein J6590_085859 [Homalodisca vitripennis]
MRLIAVPPQCVEPPKLESEVELVKYWLCAEIGVVLREPSQHLAGSHCVQLTVRRWLSPRYQISPEQHAALCIQSNVSTVF